MITQTLLFCNLSFFFHIFHFIIGNNCTFLPPFDKKNTQSELLYMKLIMSHHSRPQFFWCKCPFSLFHSLQKWNFYSFEYETVLWDYNEHYKWREKIIANIFFFFFDFDGTFLLWGGFWNYSKFVFSISALTIQVTWQTLY
jgi:hypothetical protein